MPIVETVIESSIKPIVIGKAVKSYIDCIERLAYPDRRGHGALAWMDQLKSVFQKRLKESIPLITDIISEVNDRASDLKSEGYDLLLKKDSSLWSDPAEKAKAPVFGALACVDKGIPVEAVMGIQGEMGRTLAGEISVVHIESKRSFVAVESALTKRLIHLSRQAGGNTDLIEPMLVHTSCGRMGQLLSNESGGENLPSLSYVFKHINSLAKSFQGDEALNLEKILQIQKMWDVLDRGNSTVRTPDGGLYASIIMKIAERQGLSRSLEGQFKNKFLPIEIYDKSNGDLIVGADNLDILTNSNVLNAQGFTKEVINDLTKSGQLFSIGAHRDQIEGLLKNNSPIAQGSHTYSELQTDWLTVQGSLVSTTETLWKLYDNKNEEINKIVEKYIKATGIVKLIGDREKNKPRVRRLIHHLFHTIAYSYVLDTFNRGNVPGTHVEDHLAIGDHEVGAKSHMALGQGDLDRPNVKEILTGYSVLLHSKPGKEKLPVIVMIKLDTDRTGEQAISTEETNTAIEDFREFLKLWPYFLVGDIIPVLAIREKDKGGISRLAQSVILAFGDIDDQYERESNKALPRFVPASTTSGEMVLVPADEVLKAGLKAGGDLGEFRKLVKTCADSYNNPEVQGAFRSYTNS